MRPLGVIEAQGYVFDNYLLHSLVFVLGGLILGLFLGFLIFAVGLVGEYVGRIYLEVRGRPSYLVRAVYRAGDEDPCASS